PEPSARLYVIESVAAYVRLADEFPNRWNGMISPSLYEADWHRIAGLPQLPFNGVHATQGAIDTGYPRFRDWGIESTLWFCWSFASYKCAGPLTRSFTLAPDPPI